MLSEKESIEVLEDYFNENGVEYSGEIVVKRMTKFDDYFYLKVEPPTASTGKRKNKNILEDPIYKKYFVVLDSETIEYYIADMIDRILQEPTLHVNKDYEKITITDFDFFDSIDISHPKYLKTFDSQYFHLLPEHEGEIDDSASKEEKIQFMLYYLPSYFDRFNIGEIVNLLLDNVPAPELLKSVLKYTKVKLEEFGEYYIIIY